MWSDLKLLICRIIVFSQPFPSIISNRVFSGWSPHTEPLVIFVLLYSLSHYILIIAYNVNSSSHLIVIESVWYHLKTYSTGIDDEFAAQTPDYLYKLWVFAASIGEFEWVICITVGLNCVRV